MPCDWRTYERGKERYGCREEQLYETITRGVVWQAAVNLGPNVNSQASEHHSLPSPDGRSLYVTSLRSDGLGGEDIYVTTRGADGVWGPLVNLGSAVNSDQNDRCPAFSPDHSTFYFDSERRGGQGDKDLWSVPYALIADTR